MPDPTPDDTAHAPVPFSPPGLARGAGFISGVIALATIGVIDGVIAEIATPKGSRHLMVGLRVVFHCVALLATVGLFLGLAQELVVQAASRRATLRNGAAWWFGGPRRWFAYDPRSALRLLMAGTTLAGTIGPLFPITWFVIGSFHNRVLMASAVMLAAVLLLAFWSVASVVIAWPFAWVFRRARWLGNPGAVLVLLLVLVGAQTARFVVLNWLVFRNLDGSAAALAGVALGVDMVAMSVLGVRVRRRGVPVRRRVLVGVALGALALFVGSGVTFGSRHDVMALVLQRSLVTHYLLRPLQGTIDVDRDGYGVLFGGGDCNDFNPRIHPGARDIPGNGIDENCSGADGRVVHEDGNGFFAPVPPAADGRLPSVVFLSIDAVRPDHTTLYGYSRPTTPNIAAWAAQGGAVFTQAYCTSPRSLRSFASIYTGRYPSSISWGTDNQFPALNSQNETLAEVLHTRGYRTAAFINAEYFSRTMGFFQGFDEFHEGAGFKDDADPTVRGALDWLEGSRHNAQPFFMWLHLMEPHDPYRDLTEPREFGHEPMDQYDEEIARADAFEQRVLTALDHIAAERPLYVVLLSDHGEGFNEHGFLHHSYDLHEEALRVMLVVRGPNVQPGRRSALVSLFDLYPTVLNLAGAALPSPVPSRSLVPVLFRAGPAPPPGWRDHLFAEVTPDGLIPVEKRALLRPPWKLLYDAQTQSWELYDLSRDPHETQNLYDERGDIADRMREELLNWGDTAGLDSNNTAQLIEAHRLPREPVTQYPQHVRFGNVAELLGADIPRERYHVGETVEMSMVYRVLGRTTEPVWMTTRFEREDGGGVWPAFFVSHYPINGRYLTTTWLPGEILRDEMVRLIEPEVGPGRYRVLFSVDHVNGTNRYAPSERARPDSSVQIGTIDIVP